jgi:hypothetical protein
MTTLIATRTSAAAVSRVLGATFRKSVTYATRVSGWYNTHEGFVVEQFGEKVLVTYEQGNWATNDRAELNRVMDSTLGQYASYLRNKGYEVTIGFNAVFVHGRA